MNLAEYIKGFLGIIAIIFFGIGIVVWKFRVIGQKLVQPCSNLKSP